MQETTNQNFGLDTVEEFGEYDALIAEYEAQQSAEYPLWMYGM